MSNVHTYIRLYLFLTFMVSQELINRGGEKISPLEVDGILLTHPAVAEACCFGAPDAKYGEVVAAVVVLRPEFTSQNSTVIEEAIKKHCATKMAAFKVPTQIFITAAIPKGPTGKIQRRTMALTLMPQASTTSKL